MATLTVRNLEDELVRSLRLRAAENGRSAEAEHRAILRAALAGEPARHAARKAAADRLAAFRRRLAGREVGKATELLTESRSARSAALLGEGDR